jgi:hypothetical protein
MAPMVCLVCFTKAYRDLVIRKLMYCHLCLWSRFGAHFRHFCIEVLLTCVLYAHFNAGFVRCNIRSLKNGNLKICSRKWRGCMRVGLGLACPRVVDLRSSVFSPDAWGAFRDSSLHREVCGAQSNHISIMSYPKSGTFFWRWLLHTRQGKVFS